MDAIAMQNMVLAAIGEGLGICLFASMKRMILTARQVLGLYRSIGQVTAETIQHYIARSSHV